MYQFSLQVDRPFEEVHYGGLVEQRSQDLLEGKGPIGLRLLTVGGAAGVRPLQSAGSFFCWRLRSSSSSSRLGGRGGAAGLLQPSAHLLHPQQEAGHMGHGSVQRLLLRIAMEDVVQGLGEVDELRLRYKKNIIR